MAYFPLSDCCELLATDVKTLRRWLGAAQIPLHPHPTNANIECLTVEQVQYLVQLHARPLVVHEDPTSPLTVATSFLQASATPSPQASTSSDTSAIMKLTIHSQEADPIARLALLEATVATLQQQIDQLTYDHVLGYNQEHDRRLQTRELPHPAKGEQVKPLNPQSRGENRPFEADSRQEYQAHAAEHRIRHQIPLIEYNVTTGTYVLSSPKLGHLQILPDSPEWFAWLASLSSFRFIGRHGRLSACRGYDHGPKHTWYAYRSIRQRTYKRYLGVTEHLTLTCLEHMAAHLQSYENLHNGAKTEKT